MWSSIQQEKREETLKTIFFKISKTGKKKITQKMSSSFQIDF